MLPQVFQRTAFSPFGSRNLISEFKRLHNEADGFFNALGRNSPSRPNSAYPALRLYQNDDEALLRAKLSGVGGQDLELKIEAGVLSLTGERQIETGGNDSQEEKVQRQERFSGRFERRVELPFEVEADKVEARFENGILEVKLPRAVADKPRTIQINAA
jgi:HSP20 family protein